MTGRERAVPLPVRTCELVTASELEARAKALLDAGFRLALVAGHDDGDGDDHGQGLRVVYVFCAGPADRRVELHIRLDPDRPAVPSLAAWSFPASRFERELADLFGIEPLGHPFPRPLVRHQHWPRDWFSMRRDAGPPPPLRVDAEPFRFVPVEGPGVYEIPVGPVHAGLIEPGHFRFFVVGETILKMKARLWFVHRGVEKLFEGHPVADGVVLAERISGDTAAAHALAYCLAAEDALGVAAPPDLQLLRAVVVELERVTNHVADLGALCNDVGFGVAQARALTLREMLLRLAREVTGHRLLRGAIRPGAAALRRLPTPAELAAIAARVESLVELATSNTVVMDRFKGTAVLSRDDAEAIGVLGVVARASGVAIDARIAHPFYDLGPDLVPVVEQDGDVLARFSVRAREIAASLRLIEELAGRARTLEGSVGDLPLRGGSGLGIVEGWRGTIVHRVEVGASGHLTRAKVVDPSFLTWPALSVALTDTIVPDFPLANKSFNLSYAGNDL
jgi:Ni,Fe-hydrogenase III large subunit/Ni,Fe-hydrogenase III component G